MLAHIPCTRKIPIPLFVSLPRTHTQLTTSSSISHTVGSIAGYQSQTNPSVSIASLKPQPNLDKYKNHAL